MPNVFFAKAERVMAWEQREQLPFMGVPPIGGPNHATEFAQVGP